MHELSCSEMMIVNGGCVGCKIGGGLVAVGGLVVAIATFPVSVPAGVAGVCVALVGGGITLIS